MSLADELRRIADLHSAGHLTDAEFAAAKQRLFGVPAGTADGAAGEGTPPALGRPDARRSWWGRQTTPVRVGAAAATVLLVVGVTSGAISVLAYEAPTLTGSQTQPPTEDPTPEPTYEPPDPEPVEEPEPAPIFSDSVTIAESGWSPLVDRAIASWGVILDNPTDYFPYMDLTVEQVDGRGTIVESITVPVTVEPQTQAAIGGIVPLERSAKDLSFSVTMNNYSAPDGEFFIPNTFDLNGQIHGRETNSEVTLTAQSEVQIGEFCPIYVVFHGDGGDIVGGATIDDHPPIPASGEKTFKKYLTDDVIVPPAAQSLTGYADASACW